MSRATNAQTNGHPGQQAGCVRYAVIGLGHIAQAAILPAFRHAKENSVLTALVSDDADKLRELSKKYQVPHTYSYAQYDQCLNNPEVDAVFIALPNHMHCEYSVRASHAGRHVLCEKPMAVTTAECQQMIDAAHERHARLMIAYRLHFEEATLSAIELAQSGQLGELKYFSSNFSMQVKEGDIRVKRDLGGGTLYDIGVYCINAARSLFRDEPLEVTAFSSSGGDHRFAEVDEITSAVMRFPDNRLATFTSSFGAANLDSYQIVGTKGDLRVDPGFTYMQKLTHHLTLGGKSSRKTFAKRDHFAAELVYFSNCVLNGTEPEPGGWEGLADVRVIKALYRSAQEGRPVPIETAPKRNQPDLSQQIRKPPVREPSLVHTESPHW